MARWTVSSRQVSAASPAGRTVWAASASTAASTLITSSSTPMTLEQAYDKTAMGAENPQAESDGFRLPTADGAA